MNGPPSSSGNGGDAQDSGRASAGSEGGGARPGRRLIPTEFDQLLDRLLRGEINDLDVVLAEAVSLTDGEVRRLRVVEASGASASGVERVGPYVILEQIGGGGQGVVYLAEDSRLGRRVALKVLTAWGVASERAVARFQREAAIASRLEHPGICTVYETGMAEGVPYLAMRYVEGESLARKVRENTLSVGADTESNGRGDSGSGTPSSGQSREVSIVHLMEKVARALHVAHEAGVIHRDIKPGNIMVTPEGQPIILDFGLARDADQEESAMTRTGEVFGTPAYMAPEQLAARQGQVDRRADVWALGVTLFECVARRRLFDVPTRHLLYQSILSDDPPDLSPLSGSVSRDLAVIVQTATEKDRDGRYQTALEFAEDLRRLRAREPILARPVGAVTRVAKWTRRNPLVAGLSTAVILVLAWAVASVGRATLELGDRNVQLEKKASEASANAQRAEAGAVALQDSLLEWERLADSRRLEDLLASADKELWPVVPGNAASFDRWLSRAQGLLERLPAHEWALARLRQQGVYDADADRRLFANDKIRLGTVAAELAKLQQESQSNRATISELEQRTSALRRKSEESGLSQPEEKELGELKVRVGELTGSVADTGHKIAALESERGRLEETTERQFSWSFDDPADGLKHDALRDLVSTLRGLESNPSPGAITVAGTEQLRDLALELRRRLMGTGQIPWSRCIEDVGRADSPYAGLELKPIPGLVPLGWDRESRLWEFWHIQSGERPEWDGEPLGPGRVKLHPESGREGLVMILIPGGVARLGAEKPNPERSAGSPHVDDQVFDWEGPVQTVALNAYMIAKHEVTQGQWLRLWGENPTSYKPGTWKGVTLRMSAANLSWEAGREACRRWGLELPTEAQWEYACRAGTGTRFSTGDDVASLKGTANIGDMAYARAGGQNFAGDFDDGFVVMAPVGVLKANPFGLHDVHGNVWEWCLDIHAKYERNPPRAGDGLRRSGEGAKRVVARGGSFNLPPRNCRSSNRVSGDRQARLNDYGFRPARDIQP